MKSTNNPTKYATWPGILLDDFVRNARKNLFAVEPQRANASHNRGAYEKLAVSVGTRLIGFTTLAQWLRELDDQPLLIAA